MRNHAGLAAAAYEKSIRGQLLLEYARSHGHNDLDINGAQSLFRQHFKDSLETDSGRSGNVIVSSEFFINLRAEHLSELIEFVRTFANRVTIVCYVRHPASDHISRFLHSVKLGTASLSDFTVSEDEIARTFRRVSIVARLVSSENLILREYRRSALYKKDITRDFLKIIGLQDNISESIICAESNKTLSHEALILADRIRSDSGIKQSSVNKNRLIRVLGRIGKTPFGFSQETNAELLSLSAPVVARFRERFGLELETPNLPIRQPLTHFDADKRFTKLLERLDLART